MSFDADAFDVEAFSVDAFDLEAGGGGGGPEVVHALRGNLLNTIVTSGVRSRLVTPYIFMLLLK